MFIFELQEATQSVENHHLPLGFRLYLTLLSGLLHLQINRLLNGLVEYFVLHVVFIIFGELHLEDLHLICFEENERMQDFSFTNDDELGQGLQVLLQGHFGCTFSFILHFHLTELRPHALLQLIQILLRLYRQRYLLSTLVIVGMEDFRIGLYFLLLNDHVGLIFDRVLVFDGNRVRIRLLIDDEVGADK